MFIFYDEKESGKAVIVSACQRVINPFNPNTNILLYFVTL